MKQHRLLELNLHLFDGAAGGEGATGGTDSGNPQGEESGSGKAAEALETRRKNFKAMVEGEYKDIYAEEQQRMMQRHLRQTKGLEDNLSAQKPILDLLMQRYQVQDGDLGKLQQALEADNSYFERAAEQAGMTVEQFKAMQKLERESAELHKLRQRQQGEEQMRRQLEQWYLEGEQVKEVYPNFNLKTEVENRDFLALLKAGIPMKQAYELMHMEEIKANAARTAAQTAEEQVAARIREKGERPGENGTSAQGAVLVKADVKKLTRAERAEMARRAAQGERISF